MCSIFMIVIVIVAVRFWVIIKRHNRMSGSILKIISLLNLPIQIWLAKVQKIHLQVSLSILSTKTVQETFVHFLGMFRRGTVGAMVTYSSWNSVLCSSPIRISLAALEDNCGCKNFNCCIHPIFVSQWTLINVPWAPWGGMKIIAWIYNHYIIMNSGVDRTLLKIETLFTDITGLLSLLAQLGPVA